LNFDTLVLSHDPGATIRTQGGLLPNNVNRQIVSTRNGLQKASGKYAVKIRTDTRPWDSGEVTSKDSPHII